MRRKKYPLTQVATACAFSLCALAGQSQAQSEAAPSKPQSDTPLPEVVVRANREKGPSELPGTYAGGQVARGARLGMLGNQDVMSTPFNVTSFTSDLIANQQAATLQEVLSNDPSVRSDIRGRGTQNGGGADIFTIRGFTLSNQDTALNGVFGVLPYGAISMETVERVELLKGPNALLNGISPSGGVGGSINVVPKRAGSEPLTRFTASYVSDSQFGGHIDIGRRFGANQELGVRFNGVYRDGDTAVDGQSAKLSVAAVGIDYRGEKSRISLDAGYQNDQTKAPTTVFEFAAPISDIPGAPDASRRNGQPWAYSKSEDSYAVLNGEYDVLPNTTVYGAIGHRAHKNQLLRQQNAFLNDDGLLFTKANYYPQASDSTSYQAGIRTEFETGAVKHLLNVSFSSLRLQASVAYAEFPDSLSNLDDMAVVPVPDPASATFGFRGMRKDSKSALDSFGLADTLSFYDDRMQVMLGLRHQRVKTDKFEVFGFSAAPGTLLEPNYGKSAVTPAVGLTFKAWEGVSLYANYIEALTEGKIAPADAQNANEIFPPTKTKQKEVGIKRDFGRITATVSLFEIKQPNVITTPGTTALIYKVDGQQRNRGLEFNTFGEVASGVRLLGGFTYLKAEQTKTEGSAFDGNDAVGIPRKALNLGAEWDTPFATGLTLSTRLIATGKQYADAANTLTVPGWARWDAGVRYKTAALGHPLVLRANVVNLADRSYWESVSPTTGLRISQPRTFTLSATMDF